MSRLNPVTLLGSTTIANGATLNTAAYSGCFDSGYEAVFIQMVGAASSITVTQQASIDGTNFYNVVGSTGAALGAVCSALNTTAGTYIQFSPVLAMYKRLKIVAGANSTISSITAVFTEQQ